MEVLCNLFLLSFSIIFLVCAWRVVNWAWLRPKTLEKWLRGQDLKGNAYTLFYGDTKELAKMINQTKSKPMKILSDDQVVPRAIPYFFESIQKHGNESGELDVWPELQTMAANVISLTAFGINYEDGRRVFELQCEQAEHAMELRHSVYVPGGRFLPTKRNRRMNEIDKEINTVVRRIIEKRIEAMKEGEANSIDLLDMLLDSNFKEIKHHGNQEFGMTIEEIISECKLFYLAGQETSSALLVWTMVLLSRNQEWQERAREEVVHVFGDDKPDFDGLNRLKIVTMILHESLRLYPPVATLIRIVKEDAKLGNLSLPAGVLLLVPTILLHHDREMWGEDANEFKPERFREGVSKATNGQACYLPFGGGPRICIGLNFTMVEAKIALSCILRRFSFKLSPSYAHAPYMLLTIKPLYGAPLILQKL
nr:cytochrome P450 CYP72A219-like [Ipomoea batatas]